MRITQLKTVIGPFWVWQLLVVLLTPGTGRADDWMTWASTYTHEPSSGQRIDQYAVGEQPLAPYRQDFTRSGYRHFRSTLQAGQSADNLHVVEQWGRPVIPYEQWRFPYRPYAVPYEAWGPQAPYGITNGSFGFGSVPGAFPGTPAGGLNTNGLNNGGNGSWGGSNPFPGANGSRGFPLTPQYNNEPWYDGTYPTAPPLSSTPEQRPGR